VCFVCCWRWGFSEVISSVTGFMMTAWPDVKVSQNLALMSDNNVLFDCYTGVQLSPAWSCSSAETWRSAEVCGTVLIYVHYMSAMRVHCGQWHCFSLSYLYLLVGQGPWHFVKKREKLLARDHHQVDGFGWRFGLVVMRWPRSK